MQMEQPRPDLVARGRHLRDGTEIVLPVEVPGRRRPVNVEGTTDPLHRAGDARSRRPKEESYHLAERVLRELQRSFALPDTVDADKVRATLTDGILEIRIGKREQAKPKQIQVGIN